MPWCLTHRITGVPPSVSVALKIALRSLEHHGITIKLAYSSENILDILTLNFLLCASDLIIPWCLTHRITGVPPSVSVALKITLGSLEHHGIKIKLAALNSKVIVFFKKIITLEISKGDS